jgi:type III secretory pathway component EscU
MSDSYEETMSMSTDEILDEMREQQEYPELKQHNRMKEVMEDTIDNATYNKSRKRVVANKTGICSICRYHRGENARKHDTSWKRKGLKTKYRPVNK